MYQSGWESAVTMEESYGPYCQIGFVSGLRRQVRRATSSSPSGSHGKANDVVVGPARPRPLRVLLVDENHRVRADQGEQQARDQQHLRAMNNRCVMEPPGEAPPNTKKAT